MDISITKLRPDAELPKYQTEHSAAMDLVACMDAPVTLESLERAIIPTGIALALPEGYEAQVRARSSLPAKHGVMVANGIGTIDADYRGEVGVILLNASKQSYTVTPGDRIAQLVVSPVTRINWKKVDELSKTKRAEGGYGSTGY